MRVFKCELCGDEVSIKSAGIKKTGCECGGTKTPLKAQTAPVAEVPCSDGVMVPLLLADELLEECWSATSKLESQLLRNKDLPRAYAEIVDKSFAALKKLQAARRAA